MFYDSLWMSRFLIFFFLLKCSLFYDKWKEEGMNGKDILCFFY